MSDWWVLLGSDVHDVALGGVKTHTPGVRSINAKNLLELGLDNKTNVSGVLSSFRLYSSVARPDLPGARPYSRVGYIPQFHARCR